jgi:hypothetical protein
MSHTPRYFGYNKQTILRRVAWLARFQAARERRPESIFLVSSRALFSEAWTFAVMLEMDFGRKQQKLCINFLDQQRPKHI